MCQAKMHRRRRRRQNIRWFDATLPHIEEAKILVRKVQAPSEAPKEEAPKEAVVEDSRPRGGELLLRYMFHTYFDQQQNYIYIYIFIYIYIYNCIYIQIICRDIVTQQDSLLERVLRQEQTVEESARPIG